MSLEPLLLKRGDIKEDTDLVGNGRGENELNSMERGERKRMCYVACKILHPNLPIPYYRSLHCTLLAPLNFSTSSPSLLLLLCKLQRNFWGLAGPVSFPARRDGEMVVVFFRLFVNETSMLVKTRFPLKWLSCPS